MKTRICYVLAMLMIFVLTACKAPLSVGDPTQQSNYSANPEIDPLAFLEAAGEKLKAAQSFNMQVRNWQRYSPNTVYSKEDEVLKAEMQYVSDLHGTPASYLQFDDGHPWSQWLYFHANTGFSGTASGGEFAYTAKHIKDENFTPTQHFAYIQYAFDLKSTTMFDKFCQFDHSVCYEDDGSTTVTFENLTNEEIVVAMGVQHPMCTGWQMASPFRFGRFGDPLGDASYSYSVSFCVDAEGCLCEILVGQTALKSNISSDPFLRATCSISFFRVNEKMDIQEVGYADRFYFSSDKDYPRIYHHFGDHHTAEYDCDIEKGYYHLWKVNYFYTEAYNWDTYDVNRPQKYYSKVHFLYTVLPEIDGIPVNEVYNTAGAEIDGMVIPKGICVGLYGETGAAGGGIGTLFFEDTEENVYALARAEIHNNYHITCPSYFAGQWKYVDDVPTPVQ